MQPTAPPVAETRSNRLNKKYRPQVEISETRADRTDEYIELNGTTGSELYFHWVVTAARMVVEGRGHQLPQLPLQGSIRRLPRGTLGAVKGVRFTLKKERYDECAKLIEAAGSSVPAVLMAATEAFDAAGGNLLRMKWPPPPHTETTPYRSGPIMADFV